RSPPNSDINCAALSAADAIVGISDEPINQERGDEDQVQHSPSRHQDKSTRGHGHHQHLRKSLQHMVQLVTWAGHFEIEPVPDVADLKEQKEGPDRARIVVVERGEIVLRERSSGRTAVAIRNSNTSSTMMLSKNG